MRCKISENNKPRTWTIKSVAFIPEILEVTFKAVFQSDGKWNTEKADILLLKF